MRTPFSLFVVVVVAGAALVACEDAPADVDPFDELNKQMLFDPASGVLTITDNATTLSADLSDLATPAQDLSFDAATNELSISGGNSVQLADPDDVTVSAMSLVGTELTITEGGETFSADLSSLRSDPQDIDYNDVTRELTITGGSTVQLPAPQELAFDATSGVISLSGANSVALPVSKRTFVVSPVGTPAQNGTKLRDTLTGIQASATNPALVRIEPGIFDLGTQTLILLPFIDVEGSGAGVTKLVVTQAPQNSAIFVADGVTLRGLKVSSSLPTVVTGVEVGGANNFGVRLERVEIDIAQGFALRAANNSVVFVDASTLRATTAIVVGSDLDQAVVKNSTLVGNISNAADGALRIAHSEFTGSVTGTASCVGAFRTSADLKSFDPLGADCAP